MRSLSRYPLYWLSILLNSSFGLTIIPDSISINVAPQSSFGKPLQTVKLKNQSNHTVVVDSVFIRFLNGVSSDFKMGIDCRPTQFNDYIYKGWVYGALNKTLRYVHDSLFLLQDSAGNLSSFSIASADSSSFNIFLAVNCPYCGRMPSFPKTTRFLYVFHNNSGMADSMSVHINDKVSAEPNHQWNRQQIPQHQKTDFYDLSGRKINRKSACSFGIVLEKSVGAGVQNLIRKAYVP